MVDPGWQVFARLRNATAEARAAAFAAESTAKGARDALAALAAERLTTLRELARHRLPELNADTAARAIPEFADELQAIERQRKARADELLADLERSQQEIEQATGELAELTTQLDGVAAHRDDLMRQVEARLQQDLNYAPLAAQAEQAEVRVARDVVRLEELQAEAKEKLPPYEASTLFMYLWRRGFGTADYASGGFVRRMDRRLARFLDYERKVVGYRFLKTTPELVADEVERRGEEAAALTERVESMETAVENDLGVPAVLAHGAELGEQREQRLQALDELQRRIAGLHDSLHEEVGGRGDYHRQALEQLTGFFGRAEALTLERLARSTPDPADDVLVEELRGHAQELMRRSAEVPGIEEHAHRLERRADDYDVLMRRFQRAEFDSGRSRFDDDDAERALARFAAGEGDVDDTWDALCHAQHFEPPPIVRHRHRTNRTLHGVGIALDVLGAVASVVGSGRRRGGGGFGGGFGGFGGSGSGGSSSGGSFGGFSSGGSSSGGGFGGFGGGGGGFSSGGGFGGGGGGFTSGSGF